MGRRADGDHLWSYWKYLGGAGWPRTTAAIRRTNLRANRLSGEIWGMSLFAGILGFATLLPLLGIMGRLVRLPTEAQPITPPSGMPFITAFLLLVMASIVAGVVEEAAYRGYIQGPIERRHGLVVAILVNGVLLDWRTTAIIRRRCSRCCRSTSRYRRSTAAWRTQRIPSFRAGSACRRRRVLAHATVDNRTSRMATVCDASAARLGDRPGRRIRRLGRGLRAVQRRRGVGVLGAGPSVAAGGRPDTVGPVRISTEVAAGSPLLPPAASGGYFAVVAHDAAAGGDFRSQFVPAARFCHPPRPHVQRPLSHAPVCRHRMHGVFHACPERHVVASSRRRRNLAHASAFLFATASPTRRTAPTGLITNGSHRSCSTASIGSAG